MQQTINDCLHQAMDIDELKEIIGHIESGQIQLVARDLREPSPFAQEIINARPYAFLDDAPFEERRTLAIRNRSWVDPAENSDYSALDMAAIERVREEAWPWIRSADELHDALMLMGFMTIGEVHGQSEPRGVGSERLELEADLSLFLAELVKQQRATEVRRGAVRLIIASEKQPLFTALGADWQCKPAVLLPEALQQQAFEKEAALTELIRGRLEALGPVTVQQLSNSLGLPKSEIEFALRSLEVEGFAFQGFYTPLTAGTTATEKQWCERRLLHRIHRYTIDAHRESIKPVSLQVYMQYLLALHEVQPLTDEITLAGLTTAEGLRRILQQLDGITAPATAWESDILPARLPHYDPAWLDQLCISGQVSWGRLLQPREAGSTGKLAGPVKSTPLNLVQRRNVDLWQALAAQESCTNEQLSSAAALLRDILQKQGASFFNDLARHAGLMPIKAEQALAELVSVGLVTSDNFTGLRALLTPDSHKPKAGSHERRRAIYGIEDAGRWSLLTVGAQQAALTDEQLERLIQIYFSRWGVITRKILEREQNAPPWRQLLIKLRRLELRGDVRGGRFISGVGGEQFALADTVTALRKQQKQWQQQQEAIANEVATTAEGKLHKPLRHILNATDPLNLLGSLLPDKRVPHLSGNRILFEDGLPIAVLEKEEVKLLRNHDSTAQWELQKLLQKKSFPPRLRAYIGKV